MALNIRSFKDLFKSSLFYKLDQFCDATIVTGDGERFKVHKLFLSKGSEYFQAFFRSNIGNDEDTLVLQFDKVILESILIFLYTGDAYLDEKNIADMIIVADYLLIETLLLHCRYFALRKISLRCCTSLLIASYVVERLKITDHCYRFVQIHFGSLVHRRDSDIAELPLDVFKKLLSDNSLAVPDEDTVWKAIVIWVKGNTPDRLKNVPELLTCIKWNLSNYWLVSSIATDPIFRENTFCESVDLDQLVNTSRYEAQELGGLNLSMNRCPCKMYVFICRKSFPYSSGIEMFLTYDGQLDICRKIGETDSNYHTLIALDRFVFMFNIISNKMKAFDLLQKTWVEKNNIRTSRQSYCIIRSQNRIFAIGGYIFMSNTQLSEVEYYEPSTDTWSYSTPVPSINICGASVVHEKLYVIGYLENFERLEMRALVYDIAYDVWSDIEKPKQFRSNFGIINFSDRLFIFGGKTEENNITRSVETYNPDRGEWEEFPALLFPYELPHAIILKDKLMVYDDCPGGMSVPRFSPCIWNEDTETWEDVFSPFNEIHRYEFCCIDDRHVLLELAKENKDPQTAWTKTPFVIN